METKKSKRGFGGMTPDRVREIAAKGGSATPKEARHFAKNKDAAREAGRKGGTISRKKKTDG